MAASSGPKISKNQLKFIVDIQNKNSYSGSGDVWTNIIENYSSTGSNPTSSFNSPSWLSSSPLSELTVMCVLTILGTDTAYAYHPIRKWIDTTDATFVLYHFQQFSDNLRTYKLGWYANAGGVWQGISPWYQAAVNNTYHIAIQYNSASGGQMWVNGSKVGTRTGAGTLMNNNTNIQIDGPTARSGIHQTKSASIYDRELSDNEIIENFEAIRGRYGI